MMQTPSVAAAEVTAIQRWAGTASSGMNAVALAQMALHMMCACTPPMQRTIESRRAWLFTILQEAALSMSSRYPGTVSDEAHKRDFIDGFLP